MKIIISIVILIFANSMAICQPEKVVIQGAVMLDNSASATAEAGTIRWTGVDFEGYDGNQWRSLTLIQDTDPDSTNELQILSISNDTIFLSNGGFVKLPSSQFFYLDKDGDTYGDSIYLVYSPSSPPKYVSNKLDCDDEDPSVYPGAPEINDGKDNDCDGQVDEVNYQYGEMVYVDGFWIDRYEASLEGWTPDEDPGQFPAV